MAVVAITLLSACGRSELPLEPTGVKVLLIGIDGATFSVLDRLVESGQAPNFARLMRDGSRGPLRSESPMESPPIWTSIATGVHRDDHGIKSFTVPRPEGGRMLVSSRLRKRLAVWDMASAAGRDVGIVGWWATWPAEPVRGFMISDRGTRSRWSEWTDGAKQAHITFPPELAEQMEPYAIDPMDDPVGAVADIVRLDETEQSVIEAAVEPIRAHALSVLKFGVATQLSYEGMMAAMLERGQPDLASVFLIGTDPVSHTFWHHYESEKFGLQPSEAHARLGDAIPGIYRHNDAYLGRLLGLVEEGTVVMIVSDHGFEASGVLPQPASQEDRAEILGDALEVDSADDVVAIGQSGKHHLEGVFIASGGPVRPGVIEGASIYDVAPTILALLGLPVGDDLAGRVLDEIFEPEFLPSHPVQRISSWEAYVDREALTVSTQTEVGERQALEMLKSLGYVE